VSIGADKHARLQVFGGSRLLHPQGNGREGMAMGIIEDGGLQDHLLKCRKPISRNTIIPSTRSPALVEPSPWQ